jgi:hypothetical protein
MVFHFKFKNINLKTVEKTLSLSLMQKSSWQFFKLSKVIFNSIRIGIFGNLIEIEILSEPHDENPSWLTSEEITEIVTKKVESS